MTFLHSESKMRVVPASSDSEKQTILLILITAIAKWCNRVRTTSRDCVPVLLNTNSTYPGTLLKQQRFLLTFWEAAGSKINRDAGYPD
jgi:hypothetical protein